jgi:hypothetical protein
MVLAYKPSRLIPSSISLAIYYINVLYIIGITWHL